MRKTSIVLKTGALLLAFSSSTAAQSLPPQASQANSNSAPANPSPAPTQTIAGPSPTILQNSAMQVDQPSSLGDVARLASGKITILDFWATWCGPCRHALPGLKQLQSVYGGNNVEVVSISEDEDQDA